MILFVDLEHEKFERDKNRVTWLARRADVMYKLQDISGETCLLQRYYAVTRRKLKEWGIRAIVLSGCSTDWAEYRPGCWDELHGIIREAELPILGFCGGHQMIAMAYGAPLGPVRRLRPGEADPAPHISPGYFKEYGFTSVHVVRDDPLFAGLGQTPVFLEAHYWEVKEPPAGFEVLASNDEVRVQAMRRKDRPVYGTQFHPEEYTLEPYDARSIAVNVIYPDGYAEARPDGRALIANFFKIAGILR
jgi:GMP synthase-like glutamine amidotransferase